MGRNIYFANCGTPEEWEIHKQKYPGMYKVVPATVYIKDGGICLITSESWRDWILGKTDNIPVEKG